MAQVLVRTRLAGAADLARPGQAARRDREEEVASVLMIINLFFARSEAATTCI